MVNVMTLLHEIEQGRVSASIVGQDRAELRTYEDRLRANLGGLQGRAARGVPVPPDLVPTIHFASWSIVSPSDPAPGAALAVTAPFLLFNAFFDGDPKEYLREFSHRIHKDVDDVWSNCKGYPAGGCRDFENFWRWAQAGAIQPITFYTAYQDSVRDVQHHSHVSAALHQFLAAADDTNAGDPPIGEHPLVHELTERSEALR